MIYNKYFLRVYCVSCGLPWCSVVKTLPAKVGDRNGKKEGSGNPLQYLCLGSSMDRGAWWATVHGVTVRHNWAINTFHFHLTHQLIDRARSFLCSEHQGTNKHLQTRLSFFPISIYSKINTENFKQIIIADFDLTWLIWFFKL